ncbi:serine protease [Halochromatium glycolicum]|uniref:Serine protease n=2 Tax=Halochromatium glycolicum TaxID=85075 RepID=A0AAJ0U3L4_9GAMM|nr:serine protease [Halochromatium glycolicum]
MRMQSFRRLARRLLAAAFLLGAGIGTLSAADLPSTIEQVKPSVVGIGTYQETRQPRAQVRGTGFVVADGRHVITNHHVLPDQLNKERREFLAVLIPAEGPKAQVRPARPVAKDEAHDLALLRVEGKPLPALRLTGSGSVREGQDIAFIGFPIGAALGLFPATHRGIVAAVAPVVMPARSGKQLKPSLIRRMRDPYDIYQLDATAYPGNSGSPLFDPGSGKVLGVINMVFVKEGRESALERPSGITYAIPIGFARDLLSGQNLRP